MRECYYLGYIQKNGSYGHVQKIPLAAIGATVVWFCRDISFLLPTSNCRPRQCLALDRGLQHLLDGEPGPVAAAELAVVHLRHHVARDDGRVLVAVLRTHCPLATI